MGFRMLLAFGAASLVALFAVSAGGATSSDNQKLARSILLGIGDFPKGWTDTNRPNDDGDHCLRPTFDDGSYPVAGAETPEFTDVDTVAFAGSYGIVYKSAAAAVFGLDGVSVKKVTRCIGDYFKGHQTANVKYSGVALGKLAFPHLGEHSRSARVMVRLLTGSRRTGATLYVDIVLIQRKQLMGVLELDRLRTPLDAAVEQRLARAVGQRMKQ